MTPTPTIKSITLSDGTRLEDRGEVRFPKNGDWFINRCGEAERASFTHETESTILSPVEAPAGGIERLGDWYAASVENGWSMDEARDDEPLNPLIDAACAVVNSMAYTDPVAESALTKLAATLEPFTQAVKEERFYAEDDDGQFHVRERRGAADIHVAKFRNEQDAKAVAAALNASEKGGE